MFKKSFLDEIQSVYYNESEQLSIDGKTKPKSVLLKTWNSELRNHHKWNKEKQKYEYGFFNLDKLNKEKMYKEIEKDLYSLCRFNYKADRKTCANTIDYLEKDFENHEFRKIPITENIPLPTNFMDALKSHEKLYK